ANEIRIWRRIFLSSIPVRTVTQSCARLLLIWKSSLSAFRDRMNAAPVPTGARSAIALLIGSKDGKLRLSRNLNAHALKERCPWEARQRRYRTACDRKRVLWRSG